jgi:hypothetical protein
MALASQLRKCTLPDVVGIINLFFTRRLNDAKRFVLLGFRQLHFEMFFRTDLSGLPRKPSCGSVPATADSPPTIFMGVNADKCLLRGT